MALQGARETGAVIPCRRCLFSLAFRRRFADAEKSLDRLSVKGAKHRRSLLALDGRSGMDQASFSEWRSEALGKISPLPFVVRSETDSGVLAPAKLSTRSQPQLSEESICKSL